MAVALIRDYVLTIAVSALSGGDQPLSILGQYVQNWLTMFLVRGRTWVAIPFYGIGGFKSITPMGLAVRRHVATHYGCRRRKWDLAGATFTTAPAVLAFLGQLIGKWPEGGWQE